MKSKAMRSLFRKFSGVAGHRLLLTELGQQQCVANNSRIARRLHARGAVRGFEKGQQLIRQGDSTNSVFFLIAGSVAVRIDGSKVATRQSGQHVGEMAVVEASAKRSATVIANEPTLAVEVSESDFVKIAQKHPQLWRCLAAELSRRLRTRAVRPSNPTPVLLVVSSTEALRLARKVKSELHGPGLHVRLWTEIFPLGHGSLEALCAEIPKADLAVAVYSPDDRGTSRGESKRVARDNVIFELGLCIGALGRERAYMLRPEGWNLKIPSDYLGVTPLTYDHQRRRRVDVMRAACIEIRKAVIRLGPR